MLGGTHNKLQRKEYLTIYLSKLIAFGGGDIVYRLAGEFFRQRKFNQARIRNKGENVYVHRTVNLWILMQNLVYSFL